MVRFLYTNAAPDEAAALFTAGLVLALYGVMSGVEAQSWVMTSTLFILAVVAGVGGLVRRNDKKN